MKNLNSIGLLLLRLSISTIFMAHGAQKLFSIWGGSGMTKFTETIAALGFPFAPFWAYAAALVEFIGGILLLLGIIPRTTALFLSIIMLVAIFKVHWESGFFMMKGGFEYQFLIFFVCLSLIFSGSGKLSLLDKF